jgi:hypothetical protein
MPVTECQFDIDQGVCAMHKYRFRAAQERNVQSTSGSLRDGYGSYR